MERLSPASCQRARHYLLTQARPLERERFLHHFEGRTSQGVLGALEAFQNRDGGFGKALESDYRAEGSSVLATCIALDHLREVGAGRDHPMVLGSIRYLLEVFDAPGSRWMIVPGDGEDAAHAPWWSGDGLEETFAGFRINPFAEVLARLFDLGGEDGRAFAASLLPALRRRILEAEAVEPSEVLCLLALWQSRMEDPETRRFLQAFLPGCIAHHVERDPANWGAYCLKPLWAVPDPHSPGAAELDGTIERALDFELRAQAEDGAWEPHWNWAGTFPEHWPAAQREWRGWLTLKTLVALRAFHRLAWT